MKFRKAASLFLAMAMLCVPALTGCGAAASTEETTSESAESVENETAETEENALSEYAGSSFSGTVLSVDGTTVTVSLAAEGMGDRMSDPGSMGGDVPEMPDGEMPSDGNGAGGEVPEKPEGGSDGETPAMPDGGEASDPSENAESVTVAFELADPSLVTDTEGNAAELAEGDFITVAVDENGSIASVTVGAPSGMGGAPSGMGGGMGSASGVDSYEAVTAFDEDAETTGMTYTSEGTDENAVLVENGADVTITDASVSRRSGNSTGGDNSSFYGVGAAMLVTDGTLTVSGSEITTDSAGGAGVFAYGDGTAYVSDSVITTTQDTSGGIHVAGGGTLYAENLTVETSGESSAAIRSDRGGGTMTVDGGSYTSNGTGSPAVYCTADITVSDAELTANGSEAVCIEGLNSLTLENCVLTGNMSDNEQNDCTWNVIVYQSMSGDSEVGNGTFTMTGGRLIAKNGGMFYTTNTECTITLTDVDITYADENEFFLRCTGNANARGWGSTGKNGSQCTFTADSQEMCGDIIWDSISTLDFVMKNGSTLTGAVLDDESYAGEGGSGYCSMTIGNGCTWIVTGDSTVTTLNSSGTIVDANGNTVSIIGTDGTVYVSGSGAYTVTVESYSAESGL